MSSSMAALSLSKERMSVDVFTRVIRAPQYASLFLNAHNAATMNH